MGGQTAGNEKHICTGLFAHVDAGKTTLSEAMLYQSGALRRLGRVDHQDAFLDTDHMERERGITIFSKQAELSLPWGTMTRRLWCPLLLSTPAQALRWPLPQSKFSTPIFLRTTSPALSLGRTSFCPDFPAFVSRETVS